MAPQESSKTSPVFKVPQEEASEKAWDLFLEMDPQEKKDTLAWAQEELAKEKAWDLFLEMDPQEKKDTLAWAQEELAKEKAWDLFLEMDPQEKKDTLAWAQEELAKEKGAVLTELSPSLLREMVVEVPSVGNELVRVFPKAEVHEIIKEVPEIECQAAGDPSASPRPII